MKSLVSSLLAFSLALAMPVYAETNGDGGSVQGGAATEASGYTERSILASSEGTRQVIEQVVDSSGRNYFVICRQSAEFFDLSVSDAKHAINTTHQDCQEATFSLWPSTLELVNECFPKQMQADMEKLPDNERHAYAMVAKLMAGVPAASTAAARFIDSHSTAQSCGTVACRFSPTFSNRTITPKLGWIAVISATVVAGAAAIIVAEYQKSRIGDHSIEARWDQFVTKLIKEHPEVKKEDLKLNSSTAVNMVWHSLQLCTSLEPGKI